MGSKDLFVMQFVVSFSDHKARDITSCREQKTSALSLTRSSKENNRLLSRCCSSRCTEEEQSSKCLSCDSLQISSTLLQCLVAEQLLLWSDWRFGCNCDCSLIIPRLVFYFCLMRINRKVLTFKLTLVFSTLVIPESFDSFIFCSSFSKDVNIYYFSNNSCIKLNAHWKARFLASSQQFPVLVYSHCCKLVCLCILCTLKKWSIILKLNFIS